ncbi:MAG: DUF4337 domain-containing protein [Lentisphaerae bacterium]|nr:DUF4337 domain-containing protein [Lentisphaerota bacterium]
MSRVHESLRAEPVPSGRAPPHEDGGRRPEAPEPAAAAASAAPPPPSPAAARGPGLLREAGIRKATEESERGAAESLKAFNGTPAAGAAARRDVRHTAQLLREGIARLEAENRELRAHARELERDLAEERRFGEELTRQLKEAQLR